MYVDVPYCNSFFAEVILDDEVDIGQKRMTDYG
jgi:hypothetical protein